MPIYFGNTKYKPSGIKAVYYGNTKVYESGPAFQDVEYIGSSNGAYIDTGYKPKTNFKIIMNAYQTGSSSSVQWCGVSEESGRYRNMFTSLSATVDQYYYSGSSAWQGHATELVLNEWREYLLEGTSNLLTVSINNVEQFSTSSIAQHDFANNFYLLAQNYNGAARSGSVSLKRIGRCKFYNDGVLVLDLIPCYRKSDNVIGMRDTLTNTFFTNAKSSGNFIKGPDVN